MYGFGMVSCCHEVRGKKCDRNAILLQQDMNIFIYFLVPTSNKNLNYHIFFCSIGEGGGLSVLKLLQSWLHFDVHICSAFICKFCHQDILLEETYISCDISASVEI